MARKDTVVIAWGRFNPPTTGHEVVIRRVAKEARSRNADYLIYPTKSVDRKKNPLTFKQKVRFMKRMFPKYAKNISSDASVNTLIKAAQKSESQGYSNLVVVVGADRVKEFDDLLGRYNGKDYNFDSIDIVSAGERDPDADDVTGMSASKMRKAASEGDYDLFSTGLPSGYKGGKTLYNTVRTNMGLKEDYDTLIEDLRSGGIGGPRFNRLLRFGLAGQGQAEIPLTKRAFNNFEKAQADPKMRNKVFQTTDKLFDFVLDDNILYQRLLMLLHKNQIYGDNNMTNEESKIIKKLQEKSDTSGISYDVLVEVFVRGLKSWENGDCSSEMDANQWSFSRVNSFISGGRSRQMVDSDLWEIHESANAEFDEFVDIDLDSAFEEYVTERANYAGRLSQQTLSYKKSRLAQRQTALKKRTADRLKQMRDRHQRQVDIARQSRSVG